MLADGRVVAGAAKQVPYDGGAAARAHAELEGLLAMQGKPLLVQGLAAFVHTASHHQYLTIVMEEASWASLVSYGLYSSVFVKESSSLMSCISLAVIC